MVDTTKDEIRVIYKVLHDKPVTREEVALSRSAGNYWSSLMSKVFSNKYTDVVYKLKNAKTHIPNRVRTHTRYRLEELTTAMVESEIIGSVDLISSSFLFDRSPLDLQLFILVSLGINPRYLTDIGE